MIGNESRSKGKLKKVAFPKHKLLRDPSPEQRTLPSDFSMKRDVAYLFEKEQEKYGSYRNNK